MFPVTKTGKEIFMINHTSGLAVKDIEKSIQFYKSVLAPLGHRLHHRTDKSANFRRYFD